jgi:TolB-like protein/Flp pilus assembly protein TadD
MSFLAELKRRNVIRVVIAYLVAAWLVVQVTETLFPIYGLSDAAVRLVVTLLAIGLPISAVLAWVFELTPEGVKRDKDVDPGERVTYGEARKLDRVIMIVLGIALTYFVVDKFVLDPRRDAERLEIATEQAVEEAIAEADEALPEASIAVLPFENLTGNEEDEYFSDGLADTVLHQLAQVSNLKVIARNSSFQFKGTNLDVREIGERLSVSNVLEGSVQRYGDQVRVIAQLVRTSDGTHVWSQSFDYQMADIFALHDAIATAVVGQMKVTLLPEDRRAIDLGGTDVPEAYDLLLKFWAAFWPSFTPAAADRLDPDEDLAAMALLDRALELDPDYVDALIAKAVVYNMFAFQTTSTPRMRDFIERAWPLVARAVELAPDYSSAWSIKGSIAHRSGEIDLAIEALQKAIELNPNDANAHQGLAVAYLLSKPLLTIEHMRIARQLDPENGFNRPTVVALGTLGRTDEAIALLESDLGQAPGLDQMLLDDLASITYEAKGRPDVAARWTGQLLELQPGGPRGLTNMTRLWLAVGDLDRAREWLQAAESSGHESDLISIARIRLRLAEEDPVGAREGLDALGPPRGQFAALVLEMRSRICIAENDMKCARAATTALADALDLTESRGLAVPGWRTLQRLLSAAVASRSGESPVALAQQVIDATRNIPRASWGEDIYYKDAEAFVLLGQKRPALQALEQTLLPDGGFLALDSFLYPADRGVLLSQLDGDPDYEDWKARFRERRTAMREKMVAMELAGEIPRAADSSNGG